MTADPGDARPEWWAKVPCRNHPVFKGPGGDGRANLWWELCQRAYVRAKGGNPKGWLFAGEADLADKLGKERKTIRTQLRVLEKAGLLVRWSDPARCRGRSTEYLIAYWATADSLRQADVRAGERKAAAAARVAVEARRGNGRAQDPVTGRFVLNGPHSEDDGKSCSDHSLMGHREPAEDLVSGPRVENDRNSCSDHSLMGHRAITTMGPDDPPTRPLSSRPLKVKTKGCDVAKTDDAARRSSKPSTSSNKNTFTVALIALRGELRKHGFELMIGSGEHRGAAHVIAYDVDDAGIDAVNVAAADIVNAFAAAVADHGGSADLVDIAGEVRGLTPTETADVSGRTGAGSRMPAAVTPATVVPTPTPPAGDVPDWLSTPAGSGRRHRSNRPYPICSTCSGDRWVPAPGDVEGVVACPACCPPRSAGGAIAATSRQRESRES